MKAFLKKIGGYVISFFAGILAIILYMLYKRAPTDSATQEHKAAINSLAATANAAKVNLENATEANASNVSTASQAEIASQFHKDFGGK